MGAFAAWFVECFKPGAATIAAVSDGTKKVLHIAL
jgi:hypothetical protein